MKRIFTLSMVILITMDAFTQAPQKMSYQCVVRNASGVLVTNQSIGIRISILQGTAIGSVVYQEIYNPNPQTNANGLVTVEIGGGTPLTGIFSNTNWAAGPYFLRTETDPTGGTNYSIVGTSQLLSVPYALNAKTAGTADYNTLSNLPSLNIANWNMAFGWGNHVGLYRPISYVPAWIDVTGKPTFALVATSGSYNHLSDKPTILNSQWTTSGSNIFYNSGNVGIGTFPSSKLEVNGVVDVNNNKIINIATPTNTSDAANKAYVDNNSGKHTIGETYGGGIVFYVYDNGRHGLIAATSDQSTGIRWFGDLYSFTRARADGVGAGLKNTAIIIANQGHVDGAAFAATVCNEYTVTIGGVTYGDWYLPSKFELKLLYLQNSAVGGFASTYYWSSSEHDMYYAWDQHFGGGYQYSSYKSSIRHVRAIRAF